MEIKIVRWIDRNAPSRGDDKKIDRINKRREK